jgi:hypothetical protein
MFFKFNFNLIYLKIAFLNNLFINISHKKFYNF